MRKSLAPLFAAALAVPLIACQSEGQNGSPTASSGTSGSASASETTGGASTGTSTNASTGGTGGVQVPSLVNVNLENVLNDLSVQLMIDRANVPINIQLPINLAANVCGVSVNVLALSTGGQAQCEAKSAPQELAQVVQQQMAAGGSVGGGAQGGSTAATGTAAPASGTATGGAAGSPTTSNTTNNNN